MLSFHLFVLQLFVLCTCSTTTKVAFTKAQNHGIDTWRSLQAGMSIKKSSTQRAQRQSRFLTSAYTSFLRVCKCYESGILEDLLTSKYSIKCILPILEQCLHEFCIKS